MPYFQKKEKDDKVRNILKEVIQNDGFDENGEYENDDYDTFIKKVKLVNGDIKYTVQSIIYGSNYKIFNSDLSLLNNEEFNGVDVLNAKNGFVVFYDNYTENILLLNGSLLFENNVYNITYFSNFICIQMSENSKYEIYNSNFNKITDETFDEAYYALNDNFLRVKNNGLYNLLSLKGSLLLKHYAYEIKCFEKFICFKMSENSKYEIYDSNFKKITDETFDYADESGAFLIINKKNKYNLMDMHGNILLNKNYDEIYESKNFNGYLFFSVLDGKKKNVVNRLGQILFEDAVGKFYLGNDRILYLQNGDMRYISYKDAIKRMH